MDLNINVNNTVSIIEDFGNGDIYKHDTITLAEYLIIEREEDFSDFLRGYPYVQVVHTNLSSISLGGGYRQILDWWGDTKWGFEITFPVSTKAEATPIRDFYTRNYGKKFFFTDPIDSIKYEVMIVDDSYRLQRSAYDTYFAKLTLIEEF